MATESTAMFDSMSERHNLDRHLEAESTAGCNNEGKEGDNQGRTTSSSIHQRAPEEESSLRTARRSVLKRMPNDSKDDPASRFDACVFTQRAPEEEPSIRSSRTAFNPSQDNSPLGDLSISPPEPVPSSSIDGEGIMPSSATMPSQLHRRTQTAHAVQDSNKNENEYFLDDMLQSQQQLQSQSGDPMTASRGSVPAPSKESSSSSTSSISDISFDDCQPLQDDGFGMPLELVYIDPESDEATRISDLSTPYFNKPTQDRGIESLSSPQAPRLPPCRQRLSTTTRTNHQRNKLGNYAARVTSSRTAFHADRFEIRPPDVVEGSVTDPKRPINTSRGDDHLMILSEQHDNAHPQRSSISRLTRQKKHDQWAKRKILDMRKLQDCFQTEKLSYEKSNQDLSFAIFKKTLRQDNAIHTILRSLTKAIVAHPQSEKSPPLEFLAYFPERGMRIPVSYISHTCNLTLLGRHVNIPQLRYQMRSRLDQEMEDNTTIAAVTGLLGAYLLSKGCHRHTLAFGDDTQNNWIQVQGCNSDKDNSKYVLRHFVFHLT